MIKIVTDTSSDITLKQAQEMDIILLALPVTFGDTPYHQLDDEDFTKFYDMHERSKVLPVTSQITPGQYLEVFENAKRNHDSVVVIAMSSRLSGTWQSAHIAKDQVDYNDIHIIDSLSASMGQRILVEYAVRLRQEGKGAGEITALISEARGRIRLCGTVDTLKYLIKGGRVSKSMGIVGSALSIKPILCLENGAIRMAGKARGFGGATKKMIEFISNDMHFDPSFPFCCGYTKAKGHLDMFSQLVKEEFKLKNIKIYPVGGVIGTHVGPNALIAVWMVKNK
ncbi:MAG: DegV family protein [Dehalococcoidia bacterium]|nr:DegV family protein [Dehalococcoidia bacterium]